MIQGFASKKIVTIKYKMFRAAAIEKQMFAIDRITLQTIPPGPEHITTKNGKQPCFAFVAVLTCRLIVVPVRSAAC
jgi:hypothetical protein